MSASVTSTVYTDVIKDVISKVRDEFVNNGGPGESVLHELQEIWEMKMLQAGFISGPIDRTSTQKQSTTGAGITPVHDLNVPYEGTEEYETPTAEMLFPPTPLQTPIPTPLPGSADNSIYNIPTGPSEYPTPANDAGGNTEGGKGGRPSPYVQSPSPWSNQRTPLSVDVNVAYVEGRDEVDRVTSNQPQTQDFFTMSSGKRKREDVATQYRNGGYNIPQQDGAGDAMSEVNSVQVSQRSYVLGKGDSVATADTEKLSQLARSTSKIPQLDGPIPDPFEDMLSTPNVSIILFQIQWIYNYQGVVNEDYNIVNTPAPDVPAATPAPVVQHDAADDDDDDDPLNENDDDDFDDADHGEELNTQHLVLAQFDKVTRTKNRWKCTLKDGIVHINNKDILFNKASGDFDF
ncbi:hypothetical protein SLEP1_g19749 [Rubroshorea leprosula]|uniref:Uncharacterized protein n=1 Tax=Rubroshorea leprosula TaxID=152421 RepID=A0AAV5J0C1_9ROSI|nr:hypothetical protein SLEP1_g19749 [Rubroshorea leprosula]